MHMFLIEIPMSFITVCFTTCASSRVAHDSDLDLRPPQLRDQVYRKHINGKIWKLVHAFVFNFGLHIVDYPLLSINDFGLPSMFDQVHKTILEILNQHHDLPQITNKVFYLQQLQGLK